jgi:hypothetical protein
VKGFHDEKLSAKLANLRSSRLSRSSRFIDSVAADVITVTAERITHHNYEASP